MKIMKRAAAVILVIITGFILIDCSMQKVAERHEGYTRSNLWAYYLYTDREIRNAPKLTKNYHFAFKAQEGTQPNDSSIIYEPNASIAALRDYLSSLGYIRVKQEGPTEQWEREGEPSPYFVIFRDPENHTLTLTRSSSK